MAGTVKAALSTSTFSNFHSPFSLKPLLPPKLKSSIRLQTSIFTTTLACNSLNSPLLLRTHTIEPCMCSAVQEALVDAQEAVESSEQTSGKKKLFVANLPWSYSVLDIKNLFAPCGTVKSVELIKKNKKLSKGFAFVTMASGNEAQAVVDKFDSTEVSGRVIKVEFSKRLNKSSPSPPSPPPPSLPPGETPYKVYVSNLQWKVRSRHLREFFAENFNPVSARVVFDSPSGKSAGYGFVSFATKEEAEAAVSDLNGKELMSRSVRLKYSQKNDEESISLVQGEQTVESQQE